MLFTSKELVDRGIAFSDTYDIENSGTLMNCHVESYGMHQSYLLSYLKGP